MSEARLYKHMSEADYHNDPCAKPSLSSSVAKTLLTQSPRHAWLEHPKLGGHRWEPTDEMDKGTLAHTLLLGKGVTIVEIEADDYKTKLAQDAKKAARAAGKLPVLSRKLDAAHVAVERWREELKDLGIELTGISEATILFEEESIRGPVKCRSRLDHLIDYGNGATILDLKKIASAHPDACARHTIDYGHDIQATAYRSAVEKLRPELIGRVDHVLLFCEFEPPYCVTPGRLDGAFRMMGESKWRRAVDTWGICLGEDRWPAYADRIIPISPPSWAVARELGESAAE